MTAQTNVRIDFPGGNGIDFQWPSPGHLRFEADLRDGPCSMWFNFVVENPGSDVLHCEMVNGKTALGWPHQPHVRPVFRHDGEAWHRTPPSVTDKEAGRFEFDVECSGRATEIASCYPYQLADWEQFFARTLQPIGAEIVGLGKTGMGRDYFCCRFGGGPKVIWLAARTHSGETPGSYAMEGMLAQLADVCDPHVSVIAVPFIDLDGVVEGMYGKNRPPVDFNRSWHVEETRPEIRALKEYIDTLSAPPSMAVDLHAPTACDGHFICHSPTSLSPESAERLARMVKEIMAEAESDPGIALDPEMTGSHEGWYTNGPHHGMCGHLKATYSTIAFTLESAYHATHLGVEVGPPQWQKLGRLLARNVLSHIQEDD